MTDLSLEMSLVFLAVLGLKSHNLATRSHSVPGLISVLVDLNSRSADSEAARLACCSLESCKKVESGRKNFIIGFCE